MASVMAGQTRAVVQQRAMQGSSRLQGSHRKRGVQRVESFSEGEEGRPEIGVGQRQSPAASPPPPAGMPPWMAAGLAVTVVLAAVGGTWAVGEKVNGVETRLSKEISGVETRLSNQISGLGADLARFEGSTSTSLNLLLEHKR